jgi:NADPH-dependent curcumin reductase CurA
MSPVNRQWRLAARPRGMVRETDFELGEAPMPVPAEGEILVRNLYLSFDPAMRGWMSDRPSYIPPVRLGEVMRATAVGQVVDSRHPGFSPGDFVRGAFGWQDYAAARVEGRFPVTRLPREVPLTWFLGVLGTTGLTAYFGLLEVGRPAPGETVVVSAAAGATGSVAGQIAKLKGCRAIGIAGGRAKCAWLKEEARFDAAIDYRSEDVAARLGELCPDGIHVYFDNVGGEILEAALSHIALRARIVLCGGISRYNEESPPPGPKNYMNLLVRRARLEGFLVLDHLPRTEEATRELSAWVREDRIRFREDIQEGLENAPRTLLRLFEGKNFGKQLLRIAEPPLA